jgi:hypothetical protein
MSKRAQRKQITMTDPDGDDDEEEEEQQEVGDFFFFSVFFQTLFGSGLFESRRCGVEEPEVW